MHDSSIIACICFTILRNFSDCLYLTLFEVRGYDAPLFLQRITKQNKCETGISISLVTLTYLFMTFSVLTFRFSRISINFRLDSVQRYAASF